MQFQPTEAADYDSQLKARLASGTAGDIITCRPFDRSLDLYKNGYLLDLTKLVPNNFDDRVWEAWSTDDGAARFCVPVSSVMHGFYYNVDIFNQLGLKPPDTVDEFNAVLQAVADDGRYVPLALGSKDVWRPGEAGFTNIGPTYWGGDAGRRDLISGKSTFLDQRYVDLFTEMASWRPYLPAASEFVNSDDAMAMFKRGEAAIYPGGSWEMSALDSIDTFKLGVFKPPRRNAGETCSVIDHTDLGIGVNAASPNRAAALKFVKWVATPQFGNIYASALPGNFPLAKNSKRQATGLAAEFDKWRDECDRTIRLTARFLERGPGDPTEHTIWAASTGVLQGTMTPKAAAELLNSALTSWYVPTGK